MRVMVLVKSDERTEAGDLGEEREYAEMGMFNEVLVNAGVMLAGAPERERGRPPAHAYRQAAASATTTPS